MADRFFSYYKSLAFMDHGKRRIRDMGGRKMKYHHDIDIVCAVASYNLGPDPVRRAFVFEVFAIEPGHILMPVTGRHWREAGHPTRLELVAMVPQPYERIIHLTERMMTGHTAVDEMDDFLRSKGHQIPHVRPRSHP